MERGGERGGAGAKEEKKKGKGEERETGGASNGRRQRGEGHTERGGRVVQCLLIIVVSVSDSAVLALPES